MPRSPLLTLGSEDILKAGRRMRRPRPRLQSGRKAEVSVSGTRKSWQEKASEDFSRDGRYTVSVKVYSQAAGEACQEGRKGLQNRTSQSQEGSSAEECGMCSGLCRERHPEEERRLELAAHGFPCRCRCFQGPDSCDHEGSNQEYGPGDQGLGQSPRLHGSSEGFGCDGQV
ncbi:charged multivesicular body protein 1a isoform X3 [Pantherophis guttatus]|uniref:Charged multivesicular body protein 1a isoform X3 n=1 Tax=Pantherophis guttatus TaxID=94885 RepID=A0A6P9CDX4_PANGU|nr:charged multivesicular body protein 1a isoform X3 [Pantherophis guttatus]